MDKRVDEEIAPIVAIANKTFHRIVCMCGCTREAVYDCKCGPAASDRKEILGIMGKFDLLTCKEIERRISGTQSRERELQQLIARAQESPGGTLVSAIAYNNEYLQLRGDLKELQEASAAKKCVTPESESSRSVQ